jgi:hypothetical protein
MASTRVDEGRALAPLSARSVDTTKDRYCWGVSANQPTNHRKSDMSTDRQTAASVPPQNDLRNAADGAAVSHPNPEFRQLSGHASSQKPQNRTERRRAEREQKKAAKKGAGARGDSSNDDGGDDVSVSLGKSGDAAPGDIAVHGLDLTPETAYTEDGEAPPETETLVLYARALGVTKYGVPAIGVEMCTVPRSAPHETHPLFRGKPLRIRAMVCGSTEFEFAMFGDARAIMRTISAKTLFSGVAKLVANSELARVAREARAEKEAPQPSTSSSAPKVSPGASIPVYRMACVVCKHPVSFRRYVVAIDRLPPPSDERLSEVYVGAFYGSTPLAQIMDTFDHAMDLEDRKCKEEDDQKRAAAAETKTTGDCGTCASDGAKGEHREAAPATVSDGSAPATDRPADAAAARGDEAGEVAGEGDKPANAVSAKAAPVPDYAKDLPEKKDDEAGPIDGANRQPGVVAGRSTLLFGRYAVETARKTIDGLRTSTVLLTRYDNKAPEAPVFSDELLHATKTLRAMVGPEALGIGHTLANTVSVAEVPPDRRDAPDKERCRDTDEGKSHAT